MKKEIKTKSEAKEKLKNHLKSMPLKKRPYVTAKGHLNKRTNG
jgi:hypothetical protein